MIAILGSGPSGLMAAWACLQNGKEFEIITKNKFKIATAYGFEYLHNNCNLPIVGEEFGKTCIPKNIPMQQFSGEYSKKVYGIESIKRHSNEYFTECYQTIYDMNIAVNLLYNLTKYNMLEYSLDNFSAENLLNDYEYIISTIPATVIFPFIKVKFKKAYLRIFPITNQNYNFCIFNASNNTDWYRAGNIFGQAFIESLNPFEGAFEIDKLVSSDFVNPSNDKSLFVGRLGAMDKTHLVHTVYEKTMEWLNGK